MSIFSGIKGWFKNTFGSTFGGILFWAGIGLLIVGGIFLFCFIFGCGGTSACEDHCQHLWADNNAAYQECVRDCEFDSSE